MNIRKNNVCRRIKIERVLHVHVYERDVLSHGKQQCI